MHETPGSERYFEEAMTFYDNLHFIASEQLRIQGVALVRAAIAAVVKTRNSETERCHLG